MKFIATLIAVFYFLCMTGVLGQPCVSDSSDSGSISSSGCNDWSDSNSFSSSSDDDTSGRDGNKDDNKAGRALDAGEAGTEQELAAMEQNVDAMKQEFETTITVICAVAGLLIAAGIIGTVWYCQSSQRKEVGFASKDSLSVQSMEEIDVQQSAKLNGEEVVNV